MRLLAWNRVRVQSRAWGHYAVRNLILIPRWQSLTWGASKSETLHPILQTRVGPDQFVSRILRLREDPRFRTVGPDVFEMNEDEDVLDDVGDDGDGLWFDYSFVEFLKTNYIAVQRAILLEPNAAEAGRA